MTMSNANNPTELKNVFKLDLQQDFFHWLVLQPTLCKTQLNCEKLNEHRNPMKN